MLILTGMTIDATEAGSRFMLDLQSPRLPGVSYRIETDAGTVSRLKEIIRQECSTSKIVFPGIEECEGDCRDPGNRF